MEAFSSFDSSLHLRVQLLHCSLKVWPGHNPRGNAVPDVIQKDGLPLGALVIRADWLQAAQGAFYFVALEADVANGLQYLNLTQSGAAFRIHCAVTPRVSASSFSCSNSLLLAA